MLCKTFVNHRAMGFTQRHGRRVSREALPDDFGQAQAFSRREIQDFSDVRITHAV